MNSAYFFQLYYKTCNRTTGTFPLGLSFFSRSDLYQWTVLFFSIIKLVTEPQGTIKFLVRQSSTDLNNQAIVVSRCSAVLISRLNKPKRLIRQTKEYPQLKHMQGFVPSRRKRNTPFYDIMLALAGITTQQHEKDASSCYTFMGRVREVALSK